MSNLGEFNLPGVVLGVLPWTRARDLHFETRVWGLLARNCLGIPRPGRWPKTGHKRMIGFIVTGLRCEPQQSLSLCKMWTCAAMQNIPYTVQACEASTADHDISFRACTYPASSRNQQRAETLSSSRFLFCPFAARLLETGWTRAVRGPVRARPGEGRARNGRGQTRKGECKGVRGQGRKTLVFGGYESVNRAE